MLTNEQVDFVACVSGSVCFGVFVGAVIGVLTGATVQIMRYKSLGGGVAYAAAKTVVPGAIGGAVAGLAVAVGIAIFCPPGWKGGYEIPGWLITLHCLTVLSCGAVAAMWTMSDHKLQSKRWSLVLGPIAWLAIGALVGALAGVGQGFDGYFCVQSNAGPIRCAAMGGTIGAVATVVWRLAIGRIPDNPPTLPAR